jgi:hypothetical protein
MSAALTNRMLNCNKLDIPIVAWTRRAVPSTVPAGRLDTVTLDLPGSAKLTSFASRYANHSQARPGEA